MPHDFIAILVAALTLGLVHTIISPNHYLPFVVIGRASKWSLARTLMVTLFCGLGHAVGSVTLGVIGVLFGVWLKEAEWLREGGWAAWMLIGVGVIYCVWGMLQVVRDKPHCHPHVEALGCGEPEDGHGHSHGTPSVARATPWALFVVFTLGPCEVLIPLLMYPAATLTLTSALLVAAAYSVATLAAMVTMVTITAAGLAKLRLGSLEKYSHAIAGAMIIVSGVVVHLLGHGQHAH